MKESNYCGCCGRECNLDWCDDCKTHIDLKKTFWDATYLGQHGVNCPFQNPDTAIDLGTFEEMLTVASERALAEGGMVAVHRQGCEGTDDCLCQPLTVRPYEPVDESMTKPQ